MSAASDLRHWSIEAASNLICADSSSCSDPNDCRRFAARHVATANEMLSSGHIEVETVRLGKVQAFTVTDVGMIRVYLPDGGTDLIHGDEVSLW